MITAQEAKQFAIKMTEANATDRTLYFVEASARAGADSAKVHDVNVAIFANVIRTLRKNGFVVNLEHNAFTVSW